MLNACSLLAHAPAIELYLHQHRPSIFIILEPLVTHADAIPRSPSYTPMYIPHPHGHTHGGIVMYVHDSIVCAPLDMQPPPPSFAPDSASNTMPLVISSPMLNRPFLLFPTYMSCHARVSDWMVLESVVESARTMLDATHDVPFLLIGDMNARHPLWDPSCQHHPNTSGTQLYNIVTTQPDWLLLNNQLPAAVPTHYANAPTFTKSVIDLAVTNNLHLFHHFAVDDASTLLSDHRAVCVSLKSRSRPLALPVRHVWRTHNKDVPWSIFQTELSSLLDPWREKWQCLLSHTSLTTQQLIDACWDDLRSIIIGTAQRVIGKKAIRSTSQHWFTLNPDMASLHRKYIQLRRARDRVRHKNRPIPPGLQRLYTRARYAFGSAMRTAKQQCWEELVQQVEKNHHIIWTAWHYLTPAFDKKLPTFASDTTNATPTSPVDNLNIMARHFQSVSTLPDDPLFNHSQDSDVANTVHSLQLPSQSVSLPFTQQQLVDECANINTNTALGPDDVSPCFIKHGGPALMSALFLLFHICYQHGMLPTQWTEGIIIALFKHVGDVKSVVNYRPITVTSVIIRLFERLMLPALKQHMHAHGIPGALQFGFTALRSTYDAILRLLSLIGSHFSQFPIPVVFIDISKAYDRVWVHGLLHKLYHLAGMRDHMHDLFFYRALLSRRAFRVCGNGHLSDLHHVHDGVPQGSVSAPQLFIIYLHDIAIALNSIYTTFNAYADDIAILPLASTLSLSVHSVHRHMQHTLDALRDWASAWKVTFSSTKTQMVVFWRGTTLPVTFQLSPTAPFSLRLSNFDIIHSVTYSYLGLLLHQQLKWDAHITDIIRRATPTSNLISRLISCSSRPSLPVVRRLVVSVLIPKITYALPFITLPHDRHNLSTALKSLTITPLRHALGLPHTAHHDSIFVDVRVMPLREFQQYLSVIFARRFVMLATDAADMSARFSQLFVRNACHLPRNHPLSIIASRCHAVSCSYTSSLSALRGATNDQLRQAVFDRFFDRWWRAQHPLTAAVPDPHSLFQCYLHCDHTRPLTCHQSLPIHFTMLSTHQATTLSRLRFNRSRLNQSLHSRHLSSTDICPKCNRSSETVEHVLLQCPAYNNIRSDCTRALTFLLGRPPSLSVFLGSFPPSVSSSSRVARIALSFVSTFVERIRSLRHM